MASKHVKDLESPHIEGDHHGCKKGKMKEDIFFRTDLAHHAGGSLPIENDIEASNMVAKRSILQDCH